MDEGKKNVVVSGFDISLREEPEGGFTVTVPALPGCVTFGSTLDEAIAMEKEAVELYLEALRALPAGFFQETQNIIGKE